MHKRHTDIFLASLKDVERSRPPSINVITEDKKNIAGAPIIVQTKTPAPRHAEDSTCSRNNTHMLLVI